MRTVALLTVISLTGLLALPAHADWGIGKIHDNQMIHGLRHVERELKKAKGKYKGHRSKAVKDVHHAIKHLEKDGDLHGRNGSPPVFPGSAAKSKERLHHAIKGLKHIHNRLENHLNPSPQRNKARHHIHHAIKHVEAALKVKQPTTIRA